MKSHFIIFLFKERELRECFSLIDSGINIYVKELESFPIIDSLDVQGVI